MNTEELKLVTEKVNLYALATLSTSRYEHSVRVAVLARDLCARFGLDPHAGYLAGIAHDICKSGNDRWLLSLAVRDDGPISRIEEKKPALLHGRAAAVLLADEYQVTDLAVLEAVKNHTFGAPGMDPLGQILFVADKIEPGRTGLDPEFRAEILRQDLDGMASLVLEDNIRYLAGRGKEVSPITQAMLDSLKRRKKDR
jgi:putative HD superfamily hydrolase of NAD metabolism